MDTEALKSAGLTDLQARIYLHLIERGEQTPTEIARALSENRTTIYSAADKLASLNIVKKTEKGKITAFAPTHPSNLETLAEKRLRIVARQTKSLESALPSLINFYNEHQHAPGVTTYYGTEGAAIIRQKILDENATLYFVRSPYDNHENPEALYKYRQARINKNIHAESLSPSEHTRFPKSQSEKWLQDRTLLPPKDYDSPVEIAIFGTKVAFIDHSRDAMSTLIDSPTIADAMRQFFRFARKYIERSTDQSALSSKVEQRAHTSHPATPPTSQTPLSHQISKPAPNDTPAPRRSAPDSPPQSPPPSDSPDVPYSQN
ncbi:MAG: helix-turn-helix domain-containing protein [Candidatus Nomurabacteria bacterium]|nr:helix-turn-helix domain-containing protein [Candidatus Nomurabacteria bacterium]